MRQAWRWLARVAAAMTGTVALARLGVPALIVVLAAVVVVAGVVCWVLASKERSGNAELLIRASRAVPPPAPAPLAATLPTSPPIVTQRRLRRRKGTGHG